MPLTIHTNYEAFAPTEHNEREGHLGTRDRVNPTERYDFPGKALGCLAAARSLEQLTIPSSGREQLLRLTDGDRQPLPRITILNTSRDPLDEQILKGHDAQYLANLKLASEQARINAGHNKDVFISEFGKEADVTPGTFGNETDTMLVDVSYRSPYDPERKRFTDGEYDAVSDRYPSGGKEYPYSRDDFDLGLEAHPMKTAPNIVSLEFEGIQDDHRIILRRFLEEVVPRVVAFKPDVVLWSLGLDSALGDPLGGLGNLPSSFYTLLRGMRLTLPAARHGALLEGGYDEQRWHTCLPPALLALHDAPEDGKNRCRTFKEYRSAFTASANNDNT